jgi:hypothetical protein
MEALARAVGYLGERDFTWKIKVDNLAFIQETGTRQELRFRHDLAPRQLELA